MAFTAFTTTVIIGSAALIIGALYWALLSVGLQEADDPHESDPDDLTEFEKQHTHRSDVHPGS